MATETTQKLNLPFIFTDGIGRSIEVMEFSPWGDYWRVPPQTLDGHSVACVEWEEYSGDQTKGDYGFVKKSLDCIEVFVDFGAEGDGDGTMEHPLGELPQGKYLKYYNCMTNCCLGVVFRCSGQCSQSDVGITGDNLVVDGLQGTFDTLQLPVAINCAIKMNYNPVHSSDLGINVFYNSTLEYGYHSGNNITSAVNCSLSSYVPTSSVTISSSKQCSIAINAQVKDDSIDVPYTGNELSVVITTIAINTTMSMISTEKNYGRGNTVSSSSSFSLSGGDFISCSVTMLAKHSSSIPEEVIVASDQYCGVYNVAFGASYQLSVNRFIGTTVNCSESGGSANPSSSKPECGKLTGSGTHGFVYAGGSVECSSSFYLTCNIIDSSTIGVSQPPSIQSGAGANSFTSDKGIFYNAGLGGTIGVAGNLIPQNVRGNGGTSNSNDYGSLGYLVRQADGGGTIGFSIEGRTIVEAAPTFRIIERKWGDEEPVQETIYYPLKTKEFLITDYVQANEIVNSNISICE